MSFTFDPTRDDRPLRRPRAHPHSEGRTLNWASLYADVPRRHVAPPAGIEPARMPPEGTALSPELRGLSDENPTQRTSTPDRQSDDVPPMGSG
jgi:hypothetical protein